MAFIMALFGVATAWSSYKKKNFRSLLGCVVIAVYSVFFGLNRIPQRPGTCAPDILSYLDIPLLLGMFLAVIFFCIKPCGNCKTRFVPAVLLACGVITRVARRIVYAIYTVRLANAGDEVLELYQRLFSSVNLLDILFTALICGSCVGLLWTVGRSHTESKS